MKHFFETQGKLDELSRNLLLDQAKEGLKKHPLSIADMETHGDLICINGSNISEYVPTGLEGLLSARGQLIGDAADSAFKLELIKALKGADERVFAYILANISSKEIKDYLELPFGFKTDFDFPPFILTHFSDDDLVSYISAFVEAKPDNQVEFFEENQQKSWKIITAAGDLTAMERGKRPPAILDRPFFSEVQLNTKVNRVAKVLQLPLGKLKSALPYFNKKKDVSGATVVSRSSLFLSWKDVAGFKIASSQSKYMLGVSIQGEFIPTTQFINKNVGHGFNKIQDIDYFKVRVGNKSVDLTPQEITDFEVNLDTQQVIMTRGVGPGEYHVLRVQKMRLTRGEETAWIDKVVPFNRGESNFILAANFLGRRYAEYEKAKKIKDARLELDILGERRVVAGDVASQLVLSSLNTLKVLPLSAPCVGFEPLDLKNPEKLDKDFTELDRRIRELFDRILDLSQSPNFTTHDFERLTKNIRSYIASKTPGASSAETLDLMSKELAELTQYMDDFFKLNIHNRVEGELSIDQEMGTDEIENSDDLAKEGGVQLDTASTDFIGENYHFFRKREDVQRAMSLCEKMLFYLKHIQPMAKDASLVPDLVVFIKRKDLVTHYQNTAYPALCLNGILNADIFRSENEDEEMLFIQFMRKFTDKVNQKALELNQSFHHQYKHTLAELTYLADEQKHQLTEELAFLENPANKEKAYVVLLEKITGIFNAQLDKKQENIDLLVEERRENQAAYDQWVTELEGLTGRPFDKQQLAAFLDQLPVELEKLRQTILEDHKGKKTQVVSIYNPFSRAHAYSFKYYEQVLKLTSLFQKALWIRQRQKMLDQVKVQAKQWADLPTERLEIQVKKLQAHVDGADGAQQEKGKEAVLSISKDLKNTLVELRNLSIKGMFQDTELETGNLLQFIQYYQAETEKLLGYSITLNQLTLKLSGLENNLFKAQTEWIDQRIKLDAKKHQLKASQMLLADPNCAAQIEAMLSQSEEVPKEIRQQLNEARVKMTEAQDVFKVAVGPGKKLAVLNFVKLLDKAKRRESVNEAAKELVNLRQGIDAATEEIKGEQEELGFLKSQEVHLEKVAMSKALPSTRVLLKTQYIPLVEREIKMLMRVDHFLSEVISKQEQLKNAMADGFFRKRYGFPQFVRGCFFLDSQQIAKNHTEKNITSAYNLLAEKYPVGCAPALAYESKAYLNKAESQGRASIERRIDRIWSGELDEGVIFLPSALTFEDALALCDFKSKLCAEQPRAQHSPNNVVLVYVGPLPVFKLKEEPALKEQYHQAMMSNVFIDLDGVYIHDNRASIFEALVDQTFGASSEQVSLQVVHQFFHEA